MHSLEFVSDGVGLVECEKLRTGEQTGTRFLAIPHNSNISKGLMFSEDTLRGVRMDAAYAETRARLEPVVEITQIKGDSETHPEFAPDDDFADYEPYGHYIQQIEAAYEPRPGDYVREALKTGLALEAELGVNPFEFGVIGSTDAHTGLSSAEEPNFWGKMAWDSVPEHKAGDALPRGATGWDMAAAGLVHPQRGLSMRFPRFIRKRPDKRLADATTPEQLAAVYRKQAAS